MRTFAIPCRRVPPAEAVPFATFRVTIPDVVVELERARQRRA